MTNSELSDESSLRLRMPLRARVAWLAVLVVLLVGFGSSYLMGQVPAKPVLLEGRAMGTSYMVKLSGYVDEAEANAAGAMVEQTLERIEARLSTYREASEISRFNRHRSLEPFSVSSDTLRVVEMAESVSRLSGGAFDITVAPLVEIWGFGAAGRKREIPSDEQLARLRKSVGFQWIEVDRQKRMLNKLRPEVRCDLSAIAKGYAVDQIAEALERHGYQHYMIEVGGEIRTKGRGPFGKPWRIGIEQPGPRGPSVARTIELSGWSVATSGSYRNFRQVGGRRLSHIIDPRTGAPVTHHLLSASVVHESAAMADAWATAFLVLGAEAAYSLAVRQGLAALFISVDDNGHFIQKSTRKFANLFLESPPVQQP